MNKSNLIISFLDFWRGWEREDIITPILQKKYNVTINNESPQLIIYTIFGNQHKQIKYKNIPKLLFTGENTRINFNECDYAIGYDYIDKKNYLRYPLWKWYLRLKKLTPLLLNKKYKLIENRNFCAFTVSALNGTFRNNFFKDLSSYKKVDSFGNYMNNNLAIQRLSQEDNFTWEQKKIEYFNKIPYKFTLACENSSYPGYTTEKLMDAMMSDTIPIYWGDPEVGKDFNEKSFINLHNFSSKKEAIEYIIEVDNNKELYSKIYKEPWVTEEQKKRIMDDPLDDFLYQIIEKL